MNYLASRWIAQSVDCAVTLMVSIPLVLLGLSAAGVLQAETLAQANLVFWVGILSTVAGCGLVYRAFCSLMWGGSLGQLWTARRGIRPELSLKSLGEHLAASFFPILPILWILDLYKAARRSARKSSY